MMNVRDPVDLAIETRLRHDELLGTSSRPVVGVQPTTFDYAATLCQKILQDVWSTDAPSLLEQLEKASPTVWRATVEQFLRKRDEDTKAMAEMAEKQLRAHHQFVSNMRAHAREARSDKPRKVR